MLARGTAGGKRPVVCAAGLCDRGVEGLARLPAVARSYLVLLPGVCLRGQTAKCFLHLSKHDRRPKGT